MSYRFYHNNIVDNVCLKAHLQILKTQHDTLTSVYFQQINKTFLQLLSVINIVSHITYQLTLEIHTSCQCLVMCLTQAPRFPLSLRQDFLMVGHARDKFPSINKLDNPWSVYRRHRYYIVMCINIYLIYVM